jgi:uncharacterized membrane protein
MGLKATYALLLLVFCVFLATPVNAYYGASLEVYAGSAQFCPCDIVSSEEISVKITNYGSESDTYHMSLELPEDWSGFILPQVTLASGETAVVDPVWITPTCGTRPGKYTATVVARSGASGKEYTEDLEIEILACFDVTISSEGYLETCENEALTTDVEITNLGKIDETYLLSASPDWAVLSDDSVTVDAGESETVSLSLKPPAELSGIQNVTIHVESDTSYAEADRVIRVSVEPCYKFDTSLSPSTDTVCIGSSADYQLNIDNLGTKADTYMIVTPSWMEAEVDVVTIGSNERESVRITVTPPTRGESEVAVAVSSDNHPTAVIDAVSMISAVDCRSVDVDVSPVSKNICRGDTTDFVIRVENTGTVLTAYEIDASIGTLGREKLLLGPGEVQNVILDITSGKAGTFPVNVLVYDGNVSDEDSAILNVENCYDVSFEVSPMQTSACKDDTMTFEIDVKNTGELPDEYTLKYKGREPEVFELDPGESKTLEPKIKIDYNWESINEMLFVLKSSHGVHVERSVTVDVASRGRCYAVDLSIVNGNKTKEKQTSLSIGYGVAVELAIVNEGLRPDQFDIIVDGPDWAHISHDSFYLAPLQEESFYLYLSPPFKTQEKEFEIAVLADSGKAVSGVEISAKVSSEPGAGMDQNVTGNITGNVTQPTGITGFFTAFEGVSVEMLSIAVMAGAVVLILLMRFVIFK